MDKTKLKKGKTNINIVHHLFTCEYLFNDQTQPYIIHIASYLTTQFNLALMSTNVSLMKRINILLYINLYIKPYN